MLKEDRFAIYKNLNRTKLIQAVEQSPETIIITDPQGRIEYVNFRFTELTGYAPAEVLSKKISFLKSGYHSKQFYQNLWDKITQGEKWSGQILNQKKNGDLFWEQASITPLFDQTGKITNYVAIKQDITEKKEIQSQLIKKTAELESAKQMLTKILDLSTEAIRYIDLNYNVIKTNKLYKELNQLCPSEKNGYKDDVNSQKCFHNFCHHDCDGQDCSLKQIIKGKEFIQEDIEISLLDGKHHFIVSVIPYRDPAGNLLGIMQSYRDITERKLNENKLRLYYKEIKELYARLEAEFDKGIKLHRHFLPEYLPEVAGLDYQAYFQPAARLGGDFYNVIDTGDQLLLYIVDVSGHGLDGSMINIFLREIINNYLAQQKKLAQQININELLNYIIEKYHGENFAVEYMVCLLLAVYNKEEQSISLVNAGIHIPPIYITASGQISEINNAGLPISTAIDLEIYQNQAGKIHRIKKFNLTAGDLLFMTTDGLVEESNQKDAAASDHYGLKRLKNILTINQKQSAAKIIDNLNSDFKNYAGSQSGHDDISYLVIKVE